MEEITEKNNITFDEYLDAKGLNCPLPILKTKVLLNKMPAQQVLRVDATDPHSQVDFEAYCARANHELLTSSMNEEVFTFFIRRAKNPKKI